MSEKLKPEGNDSFIGTLSERFMDGKYNTLRQVNGYRVGEDTLNSKPEVVCAFPVVSSQETTDSGSLKKYEGRAVYLQIRCHESFRFMPEIHIGTWEKEESGGVIFKMENISKENVFKKEENNNS